MTLDYKQREALRNFAGNISYMASIVNDDEDIQSKCIRCGLTVEQVKVILEIMG